VEGFGGSSGRADAEAARYERPHVVDFGDLLEMTKATSLFGQEDGATKLVPIHHTTPVIPSDLAGKRQFASVDPHAVLGVIGGRWEAAVPGRYERPQITDYGDLLEMTAATSFVDIEDGGSKLLIHHTIQASDRELKRSLERVDIGSVMDLFAS
jgi:hypothetical protein